MLTEKKIEGLVFKYRKTEGEFIILIPAVEKAFTMSWKVVTQLHQFIASVRKSQPGAATMDASDLFLFRFENNRYSIARMGAVFTFSDAELDEFILFVMEISIAIVDEKNNK